MARRPLLAGASPLLAALLLLASATAAHAQVTGPLRVYLDCQRCDFDYLRERIPVVDYVRDPGVAHVHVLVTQQNTAGGGDEHTLRFIGLQELAGRADTLRYVSRQTDTEAEVRAGMAQVLGMGLVRYLAHAQQTDAVELEFQELDAEPAEPGAQVVDPWNLWVFRASMSGEVSGETLEQSRSFDGSFSASRTTEEFKIDFNFFGEHERDEFEFDDGETRVSSATFVNGSATAVWSLGPHWSWGFTGELGRNSRANQDLFATGGPALEYSFYPYAEATSRQITALYRIGAAAYQYADTTIFGQLAETRPHHSLEISADFRQPWGELVLSVEGSHYLDDIEQHRVDVFTNLEIRLFRGFNLDIRGNVARVKDQIYLPIAEVDLEDRLTGRVEVGTDYEYSVDVGFSLTFGSIFNNVVNPRMRTGGRFGGGGDGDFN